VLASLLPIQGLDLRGRCQDQWVAFRAMSEYFRIGRYLALVTPRTAAGLEFQHHERKRDSHLRWDNIFRRTIRVTLFATVLIVILHVFKDYLPVFLGSSPAGSRARRAAAAQFSLRPFPPDGQVAVLTAAATRWRGQGQVPPCRSYALGWISPVGARYPGCAGYWMPRVGVMTQTGREGAGGVFISYRRADPVAGYASEGLFDRLVEQFGNGRVFKDVDSIQPGDNFVEKIRAALSSCEVLLAVIGPRWITVTDEQGERRLDDPMDYVRLEIETALSRDIHVIPVLLGEAQMPKPSQLPDCLKILASCQAVEVRPSYFKHDVAPLLQSLNSLVEPLALPVAQSSPNDVVGGIADELAEIVRKQWEKETGLRGFHTDVQLLNVSWQPATDGFESWPELIRTASERRAGELAVAAPPHWADSPAGLAGADYHEISAVLDRVPTRRLVVLGEPGAGKTMLLIQLLEGLLSTRRPGDAVPVIVSLASWRPADESLYAWLRRRLPIDYPNLRTRVPGRKISRGRALLDQHKILLLLDGLDEIPEKDRPDAIRKINRELNQHPEGVVIACRRQDYLHAAEPSARQLGRRGVLMHAAAGIVLQPLQPDEVARYLRRGARSRRAAEAWEPVIAELNPGTAVGKVLTTPLNVTLAHAIYNEPDWQDQEGPDQDPADLLDYPTPEKITEHLYGTFIKAAYRPDEGRQEEGEDEKKPPPKLDDAERWLTFLAREPGLAWWQLRDSVSPWLVPLVIGLTCGIATAIAAMTGAHAGVGIGMGLGVGMIVGLAFGQPFRLHKLPFRRASPEGTGQADESRPLRGVCGGFIGSLASGLAAGLAASLGFGHTASPVSGLPVALAVGLGTGAATTFVGGLVGGVVGGFAAAYLEGVGTGLPAGIANGLGLTLVVAVIVKLVGRDTPAIKRQWSKWMGLGGGLIIGGAVGVIAGVKESPVIGLILGAAVGAAAAWPVGLVGTPADRNDIASPGAALARDARAFWTTALAGGGAAAAFAFVGDGLASIFEVHAKFSFGLLLADGLGVGISSGLVVGLAFGMYHATSPSFLIARVWLSLRAELPWHLMAFLADAHKERGVLRQNGAVYEFRHAEIKRYLAARARESVAAGGKPPRSATLPRGYAGRPRELGSPA
jgi:TIR domain/NACHT domain